MQLHTMGNIHKRTSVVFHLVKLVPFSVDNYQYFQRSENKQIIFAYVLCFVFCIGHVQKQLI